MSEQRLTHLDDKGRAHMVDVSAKSATLRIATARGWVQMQSETLRLIESRGVAKGDVLAVAQVAAIMAAKRTPELIPMCHPLQLSAISMDFALDHQLNRVNIEATVRCTGKTGVEIEALTAVSVAGLTIYDMCKAVDRAMVIGDIRLMMKSGGKSGVYQRKD
ncbi:MAG: cyclic pyranopterin monophosphate synthase MoaC [Bacillota bacterium]|nr:cyclic pyranopterin monophosphate synthase MoaC [Bacillota bacterium]